MKNLDKGQGSNHFYKFANVHRIDCQKESYTCLFRVSPVEFNGVFSQESMHRVTDLKAICLHSTITFGKNV